MSGPEKKPQEDLSDDNGKKSDVQTLGLRPAMGKPRKRGRGKEKYSLSHRTKHPL